MRSSVLVQQDIVHARKHKPILAWKARIASNPTGETGRDTLRVGFDRRLKLESACRRTGSTAPRSPRRGGGTQRQRSAQIADTHPQIRHSGRHHDPETPAAPLNRPRTYFPIPQSVIESPRGPAMIVGWCLSRKSRLSGTGHVLAASLVVLEKK